MDQRAAGRQAGLRGTIKLARKKHRDPGNPRIRWLGNNQVVSFARGKKKIARVVEGDMHARIVQHIAIQLREQWRGVYDGRFDFDNIQALEFRVTG